jgi:protein phosphatase
LREQKHMGSRAVVVVCRDEAVSVKRFDVIEPAIGVVYTRTGRPFFSDSNLEREVLQRVQQATTASGLWDELSTDWLCLDCELMPWSVKAQELLHQYAPAGSAGVHALTAAKQALEQARDRVDGIGELFAQLKRVSVP